VNEIPPDIVRWSGARAVVLVLDTSTSMGALHTGRSSLDRAKERAASFLAELPDGSQVTLVASRDDQAGGAARALLEKADPAEVRTALPGVRAGHGPNRLGPLFAGGRDGDQPRAAHPPGQVLGVGQTDATHPDDRDTQLVHAQLPVHSVTAPTRGAP